MAVCGVCSRGFFNTRGLRLHKMRTHGGYHTTAVEERLKIVESSGLQLITMEKDQAQKEWKEYCTMLKTRKEKYLKDMKDSLYHLKQGRKLLDVRNVFKETGKKQETDEPSMAIARADWKLVTFEKQSNGAGRFCIDHWNWTKQNVELPPETWPMWTKDERGFLPNNRVETKVPVIPAPFLPDGPLSKYYIMWEVDQWKPVPSRDPILLKRINKYVFAVLAMWDLTDLEMSIVE